MHSKSKELRVLKAVNRLTNKRQRSPTIRELKKNLGYGSTNSVWYWLNSLALDGYLDRSDGGRNIITEAGVAYVMENTR